MTKIRQSIEEVLADFVVTDELRRKTLQQIIPEKQYKAFKPGFYFRALTLMSSFVVLLTLSINGYYHVNQPEAIKPFSQEGLEYNTSQKKSFDLKPHGQDYGQIGQSTQQEDLGEETSESEEINE
jgi:hypothetical protein